MAGSQGEKNDVGGGRQVAGSQSEKNAVSVRKAKQQEVRGERNADGVGKEE